VRGKSVVGTGIIERVIGEEIRGRSSK